MTTAGTDLKFGVIGVIDTDKESVASQITAMDENLAFEPALATLPKTFKDMSKAKPDICVLLYQGNVTQAAKLAGDNAMPKFDIILCLGDDEPSKELESV